MIRAFHWTPTSKTISPMEVDEAVKGPSSGWVWIDIADDTEETVREVGAALGIEQGHIQEAVNRTNYPLVEETPEYLYVVIHGFTTGGGKRLETSEVDIFIGADFLLTVRTGELPMVEAYVDRIAAGSQVDYPSPASFMAAFALIGSRRFQPLILALETQIDLLEDLAMEADPRVITEVHALRRDLIVLQRAIAPQRDVYVELAEMSHPLVTRGVATAFDRVAGHQIRTLESIDAARSLLGSVVETHRGAVADQTNEIVRLLTVFSAIMLPLGLIAGMWGMNFIEIPMANRAAGFWIMVGIMALIAVSLWLYFGRRGFVGAPRLSELPKAVGLGLVELGTAPIKLVADGVEATVRTVAKGIGLGDEQTTD